jgi:hypothetical protein
MKSVFRVKFFVKKPFVIHPFLFAAFFVVFLYAHNISETSANQILMPLGVSLALTLVLWVFLSVLIKDMVKAGLATSVFVFFFFTYGRFYELLENGGFFVPRHGYLLPTVLLVFGYCVYFIKRTKRNFLTTTRMLNIGAVVLIAINAFTITSYEIRTALSSPTHLVEPGYKAALKVDQEKLKTMPDIYLIILDEYAHPDTMREYYKYDNSQFINGLEEKGFFIAHNSKTPSGCTQASIASLLNMKYIGGGGVVEKLEPLDVLKRKIANNTVASFLKASGYYYVCFNSPVIFGGERVGADLICDLWGNPEDKAPRVEFESILWNTTMLKPFYVYCTQSQDENYYRRVVINTLNHLKKVPDIKGPKFVFVYLMCPHEPFVFGPNGEHVAFINHYNYKDKHFYKGQYIFISEEIKKVVRVILEKSVIEPIIIIQSDHGLRPHHRGIEIGKDEWRKILNAYYLPGDGKELLYDSISPVNSFRLIFNHYFNADYDLLED